MPAETPIPKCGDGLDCVKRKDGFKYAKFPKMSVNEKMPLLAEVIHDEKN